MKIKNMMKRCLISLFLINFSFLLCANNPDIVIFDKYKEKYGLIFYLDFEKEYALLIKIESKKYNSTVIVRPFRGENDDIIDIKKREEITLNKEVKRIKFKVDGSEETVLKITELDEYYKKKQERKKTKEEIVGKERSKGMIETKSEESKENKTIKENIESKLKEPNCETIILDGIKAVDNGEFVEVGSVINNSDYDVILYILNEDYNDPKSKESINLKKGDSKKIDRKIRQITVKKKKTDVNEIKIWSPDDSRKEWAKNHKEVDVDKITNTKQEEKAKEKINKSELIKLIKEDLEKDTCWSESSIAKIKEMSESAEKNLGNTIDKDKYAEDNGVFNFIAVEQNKILEKNKIDKKVEELISNYRKIYDIENEADCKKEIHQILENRNTDRADKLKELGNLFNVEVKSPTESPFVSIVVIVLIVIILIVCLTMLSKKKHSKHEERIYQPVSTVDTTPNIVVRKTSSTVLKKQRLDDVINNNSYYLIESVDFCEDSAVKRIYIKNTCVKDIYNMYAEDLRNPNNPKEDGCMVLGRWIYDEQANEYNVSLEEIVRPGDDAIFQEYELNFGGKIKLRVAERLRKLRRDTNLQYDLTCWVHSHPGLGVFFSNSDSSVQMQLKHSTHPNFLTAIVVDILTPEQDFGIFTFKRDSSINSRNDLKKMYSLEELHKWAVESERISYKPEDHYNVLSKAESVSDNCQGIQLTNGAVIDISSITTEDRTGLAGWIYGYKTQSRGKNEYVVNTVSNADSNADNDLLGCLVIGTRCSIPSIRKAIADHSNKINFVMFYSVKDETITTIPMMDMQLSMDEKYYSEEKLEDLKIWTRRKR